MATTTSPTLLRVARPRECNTQQTPAQDATTRATSAQQGTLKALALLALGRNNPRNTTAKQPAKTAQQHTAATANAVARVAFPRCATTQQTSEPIRRPVLHFRLNAHTPNAWATAIGRPGESIEQLRAELQARFGAELVETREQGAIPSHD